MVHRYQPREIENKWQERWDTDHLYEVGESSNLPKFYALTMLPYTSGDLHIGHWYAMAPSDVYARFKRMQGFNVLHPMGFDAFGLPAENAAIKHGIHPYEWTINNIEKMRRQLKSMGAIYDWNREVISCHPEYYKWTQWFFLKFYQAGLAYRAKAPVNWCPNCKTVLANEQVVGGNLCERCGTEVNKKDLEQWFLKITQYAEELLDFSDLIWPEKIKTMQKNWIGKSEGAEISFGLECEGLEQKEIKVFTTRPDTIFGVTFFLLAPENSLVPQLTTPDHQEEVAEYISWCRRQADYMRTSMDREKTGAFLGSYAINKLNGEKVPIWITDYVLPSYGTGAVMGVPAHDERDFEFARKFHLPIRPVIALPEHAGNEVLQAYDGQGIMINSGEFNGLSSERGYEAVCDLIEKRGFGKRTVTYRLRDWLISRQRYWGAPIPVVYCPKCGTVPVPEEDLPVLLPPNAEFRPTGESPLKYCPEFVNTTCPICSGPAQRETDTLDTFMCSSWYYLRYSSTRADAGPFDIQKLKYWLPVDLYTGGAEHAVMHLFYSRFFIKAMRDIDRNLINFDEPFKRLFNQGIIAYHGGKMSKSKGNVIAPDKYVSTMGADTVRAYLMFIGPWELGGGWSDRGIRGISRWLNRVWNLVENGYSPDVVDEKAKKELTHIIHKTIKKTGEDMENLRFNTMLACLMEFTNHLSKVQEDRNVPDDLWQEAIKCLLLLLAPTAPHITEELWSRRNYKYSIHNQPWPKFDARLAEEEQITLAIQINGKLRDKVLVPASIREAEATELVWERTKIKSYTKGKEILKTIYVPGRVVNIVIK